MKTCFTCTEEKPKGQFYTDRSKRDGLFGSCKVCVNKQREGIPKRTKERSRELNLKRRYGISCEDFNSILNTQKCRCAICGGSLDLDSQYGFAVDHNHSTNAVRGILCHACNKGIGLLKDSPEILLSAARYLQHQGHYG